MKNFLLGLAATVAIISCRSADDKALDVDNFAGKWTWVSTQGGTANVNQTPENTGKSITMDLTADHKFTITENSKVTSEGTYTLFQNVTNTDHENRVFINFSNGDSKAVRSVNSTDLYLYDDTSDGFTYHYKK